MYITELVCRLNERESLKSLYGACSIKISIFHELCHRGLSYGNTHMPCCAARKELFLCCTWARYGMLGGTCDLFSVWCVHLFSWFFVSVFHFWLRCIAQADCVLSGMRTHSMALCEGCLVRCVLLERIHCNILHQNFSHVVAIAYLSARNGSHRLLCSATWCSVVFFLSVFFNGISY